jgi:phenylacetate-CoA ligase
MPFIRYRTGDCAIYGGAQCRACGRNHQIMRSVRGHRTQEVLIARDGTRIPWTALNMHDDTFRNVQQFQFRQTTAGQAELLVVPAPRFDATCRERIQRALQDKLDGQVSFSLALVEQIRKSPAGKATYVDQRLEITNETES